MKAAGLDVVTGGAGFIGSELVRQLRADGRRVLVVDNLANGKRENLAGLDDGVSLLEADVRDAQAMARALGKADRVFHLACLGVRHSLHSPLENHEVNAAGTLTLLQAARAAGVERFVYVSTSEVYGPTLEAPMGESHPTFPTTVYGASKLAGECYTRAYHRSYGMPTVVVRPFNSFGPRSHHEGDCGEVIPKFMLRALAGKPLVVFGDGRQTRDFTFVEDTARGIKLAATAEAAIGRTLNLGSGREIEVRALADEVSRAAGSGPARIEFETPRPGDIARLIADSSAARELLGFAPRVSLGEGLARLRAWYESLGAAPETLLADELVRNWERP